MQPTNFIILKCSERKNNLKRGTPLQIYDNRETRLINKTKLYKYVDIWFVSGKYGLIKRNETIENYNHKLKKTEVNKLKPIVINKLKKFRKYKQGHILINNLNTPYGQLIQPILNYAKNNNIKLSFVGKSKDNLEDMQLRIKYLKKLVDFIKPTQRRLSTWIK